MENNNEDRLKALIRVQELKAPAQGFTEEVMKEILTRQNAAPERDRFQQLLQSSYLSEPTAEFTFKVLKGVRGPVREMRYKPVINRATWGLIVLFFVACIIVGFTSPDSSPDVMRNYDSLIANQVSWATRGLQDFFPYAGVILSAIVLLLSLERRLRKEFSQ